MTEKQKAQFDADYSPKNPQNQQATRDHGLRWSARKRCYVDEEGLPVRDRYGQKY